MGDSEPYRSGFVRWPRMLFTVDSDVNNRAEFFDLADSITFRSRIPSWGTPFRISLIIPLIVFSLGFICAFFVGSTREFLTSHSIYIFTLNLMVALWTTLWLERAGPETVVEIESAFESSESEYYELMGAMLAKMYQPFPHTHYGNVGQRYVLNTLFFLAIIAGFLTFAVIPTIFAPELFSHALGMDWVTLHPLLRTYVFGLVLVATIVGVAVSWIVVVGTWYMGVEAQQLRVELNVTRVTDNLGLTPYAQTVILAACAYLLTYLITTSSFLFIEINVFVIIGLAVMSGLPLLAFLGSQYGLHIAIRRSKHYRLQKLNEEFDGEIQLWFRNDGPRASTCSDSDINELVAVQQSIESLPNWPIRLESVAKLASAAFGSNIWVVLELALVLN